MALSLAQLLTPKSEDEALTDLLAILDGLGFSASSWQSGSIQRTLVQLVARLQASASNTTLSIAKGRYNDLAEGDWLSLLSTSQFDNTRIAAVATRVTMTLSDPLSVGPTTIVTSQLVAKDQAGATYRNNAGGTLAAGGTLSLQFDAEVAGRASPSTLTLTTPLAGITAVIATVDPIVRPGADAESDSRLRTRNKAKWSTLAYAAPADAYIAWALAASPSVTRAWVDDLNPRGPGTLDLYLAGPTAPVPGSVLTTVLDYIDGNVDGIYRRPLGSDLQVFSATAASVSITGTLYVLPAYSATAVRDLVYAALEAYFEALPVGGTVLVADLYRVIMGITGVRNVHLTAPTVDTTVSASSVPTPAMTLAAVVG
jgi:uncharacterized phage protein gp47/JayE